MTVKMGKKRSHPPGTLEGGGRRSDSQHRVQGRLAPAAQEHLASGRDEASDDRKREAVGTLGLQLLVAACGILAAQRVCLCVHMCVYTCMCVYMCVRMYACVCMLVHSPRRAIQEARARPAHFPCEVSVTSWGWDTPQGDPLL